MSPTLKSPTLKSPILSVRLNLFATTACASLLLAHPFAIAPVQAASALDATATDPALVEAEPAPPAAPAIVPTEAPPEAAPAPLAVDSAEAFIDRSTDYNLGATQQAPSGYEAPSEVVIIPGTQNPSPALDTSNPTPAIAPESVTIAAEREPVSESVVAAISAADVAPSSNSMGSYASVNPGLPYVGNKLLQAFARMGNENLKMLFPVAIPAEITSLFGWRIHPISGSQRMHTGTDIGAPMGTPVLATLSGRVILADMMGGYGLTVAIEHDNGIRQTMYAHMSELFVKPGDMVQQGAVIGRVGSTGASTGPHLHFEFRQMMPDGTWVALDAGQHLQVALGDLVRSLQIAQLPIKPIVQTPKKP